MEAKPEKTPKAEKAPAKEKPAKTPKPPKPPKPGQVAKKQAEMRSTLETIVRMEIKVEEEKKRVDANFRAQLAGLLEQKKKALENMDNLLKPLPLLDGLPPAEKPKEAKPVPTDGFGKPLIPGKRRGRPKTDGLGKPYDQTFGPRCYR